MACIQRFVAAVAGACLCESRGMSWTGSPLAPLQHQRPGNLGPSGVALVIARFLMPRGHADCFLRGGTCRPAAVPLLWRSPHTSGAATGDFWVTPRASSYSVSLCSSLAGLYGHMCGDGRHVSSWQARGAGSCAAARAVVFEPWCLSASASSVHLSMSRY